MPIPARPNYSNCVMSTPKNCHKRRPTSSWLKRAPSTWIPLRQQKCWNARGQWRLSIQAWKLFFIIVTQSSECTQCFAWRSGELRIIKQKVGISKSVAPVWSSQSRWLWQSGRLRRTQGGLAFVCRRNWPLGDACSMIVRASTGYILILEQTKKSHIMFGIDCW